MQQASDVFDRETGLGIDGANWHSMAKPFQSQADAIQGRDDFVTSQMYGAKTLGENGYDDLAISAFAIAAHTMMDSTSPDHVSDSGHLYVWPTPWNAPLHGNSPIGGESLEDLLNPKNGARLQDAINKTRSLWKQMPGEGCSCSNK